MRLHGTDYVVSRTELVFAYAGGRHHYQRFSSLLEFRKQTRIYSSSSPTPAAGPPPDPRHSLTVRAGKGTSAVSVAGVVRGV